MSVRPSPIAGTWYSDDADALRQQVRGYLQAADALPTQITGHVIGLLAPHAGLRYSGSTAGAAFAAVMGQKRDLVVVLSPHHSAHASDLLTTAHTAYATPLGDVPVDVDSLSRTDALLAEQGLHCLPIQHDHEHALEIELPFLQVALANDFRLLPIMVRSLSPQVAQTLGMALAQVLRGVNALIVASSDLSHFYTQAVARCLDLEMLRRVENFAPDELFAAQLEGKGYACGIGAIAAMLWAARALGANSVKSLQYTTSADVTGDTGKVVGYGAAAVVQNA